MIWRWEEKTRRAPWDQAPVDPLIDRAQTVLGAGNVAQLRKPRPGDPRFLLHVNTTAVATRAVRLLHAAGVPWVPVLGKPLEPIEGAGPEHVLLNVGRMNAVLAIDETSHTAQVQSGSRWRRAEFVLRRRGLTLGPTPSWLFNRTVLESFATRDLLRPSPMYGQHLDNLLAVAASLPGGASTSSTVAPRRSMGPDLGRILIGGAHRHGLLTEVHLQLWALPAQRVFRAVRYADWPAAVAGALRLLGAGVRPEWWRFRQPERDAPVELLCALAGPRGLDGLAGRFDAEAAGEGASAEAAAELHAATFLEPSPDPRGLHEDLGSPPACIVHAPLARFAAVAAQLPGADVWDLDLWHGALWLETPPDELSLRRLQDAGARVVIDGRAAPVDAGWAALDEAASAALSALPPIPLRPGDLPARLLRAGSPHSEDDT